MSGFCLIRNLVDERMCQEAAVFSEEVGLSFGDLRGLVTVLVVSNSLHLQSNLFL
jgi:hypothetical protein